LKAADALIAWTPAACARVHLPPEARATMGDVAVLAWPDVSGLARAYARTLGACDPAWREASAESLGVRLAIAFNTLVLRDGIDPSVAHANLRRIEEYRLQSGEPRRPLPCGGGEVVRLPAAARSA
jgi:hypothetical protein